MPSDIYATPETPSIRRVSAPLPNRCGALIDLPHIRRAGSGVPAASESGMRQLVNSNIERDTVIMVRKQRFATKAEVRLTFVLPEGDERLPASVVGDFNDWDPLAHPFRRRSNRSWSVAVTLPEGTSHEFRYLGDGGRWFDEEPNGETVRVNGGPNRIVKV